MRRGRCRRRIGAGTAWKYAFTVVEADLDSLLAQLWGLSPGELARVKTLVDTLASDESRPRGGRFRTVAGVLSDDDACAMIQAANECEQIDSRGW